MDNHQSWKTKCRAVEAERDRLAAMYDSAEKDDSEKLDVLQRVVDGLGGARFLLLDEDIGHAVGRILAETRKERDELARRSAGTQRRLARIRTKADLATGFKGDSREPSLDGRAAGAEGAVDLLVAEHACLLTRFYEKGGVE